MRTYIWGTMPLLAILMLAACSGKNYFAPVNARTSAEVGVLASTPFNAMTVVSGVDASNVDSLVPNLIKTNSLSTSSPGVGDSQAMVHACDINAYETEKAAALAAAKNDPDRKTIPIRFAISVGSLFDDIAYYAHLRAILRADAPSTTPIVVAPANSLSDADYNGVRSFHYFVDHTQARNDFKTGTKCFFDTVTIVGQETGHGVYRVPGQYDHPWNIMFYGDTYNPNDPDVKAGLISPRLFARTDQQDYDHNDPQIVPLYMIDIRNQALRLPNSPLQSVSLLNPSFASSAIRRHEYTLSFRDEFLLKNLFSHYEDLVTVLSSNRRLLAGSGNILAPGAPVPSGQKAYSMSGYEGVPQALRMILSASALQTNMMSTQYTPIVLDLGQKDIRLSSVDWGTYFNLGALQVRPSAVAAGASANISHQTGWLGGDVIQDPIANAIGPTIPRRVADDGFLVLPDENGQITSSRQLFGSLLQVTINGHPQTFANGFLALAALAGKDCSSSDLKKQFVGPWDGDLYANKLKVWVDANRNGVADDGEVSGLEASRVGAIDACAITEQSAQDTFGNSTKLRSAFLYLAPGEKAIGNEDEILSRLSSGKKADGSTAEFRVAIDVLFVSRPGVYLESVDPSDIFSPDVSSATLQMAGPVLGLPPVHDTLPTLTNGARR